MHQKKVSFLITRQEKVILKNVTLLEPFLQDNIGRSRIENGMIRIRFDFDDLHDAVHAVEYAAQCMVSYREQGAYNILLEKLKIYLQLITDKDYLKR